MTADASRSPTDAQFAISVLRLAVLIEAGLAPAAAWRHVAEVEPRLRGAVVVAAALDDGESVSAALRRVAEGDAQDVAWASLAAAWSVATVSGAPLAAALRGFADSLRDRQAAARDIEVALAGPRATARIVQSLPAIAVVLGLLLGVDLVATVMHPVGAASIVSGVVLLIIARRWMHGLVRGAAAPPPTAGLALDLLAVGAAGGGPPEAAQRLVALELDRVGLSAAVDDDRTTALVRLSRRSGAPLGELARAEAREDRAVARADARAEAERLAVRLMLPLGACTLPSFLALGVVPIVLGLISSTSSGL